MPKKKAPPVNNEAQIVVQNTIEVSRVENDFAGAMGFGNFPQNQGNPYTEQLSNVTTFFKNLRWYLVSNFRQFLCEAYVEIGLVQTIVDVPVDDGLRGGVEFHSKQLSEDQIKELQLTMDRENDFNIAGQAAKWNRLFGGAGILIMTDQDPESELDLDALTPDSPLEFRAVDMWELFWDQQNLEGYDVELQEEEFDAYSYYSISIDKSRVLKLKGLEAPSFIRPRLRGWGFSVVETLVRSMNQYLKATDLGFEVLDEFKLDVYKIKNLVNTLSSPNGEQKVKNRIQTANWQKNYQNAIVMDSEDDFDHKQLSFAGLAEAMAGIRMQVAADMRMPLTKLFGISAAGFNSGEDDIEVYNAMVESQVRGKLKYDILRMAEIRCQWLWGFIPEDLEIKFKPLRVMSSEQEETVKTAKFGRVLAAKQAGEISSFEFREACNKGALLEIQLDTTDAALNEVDEENQDDADMAAASSEDGEEEPGANKPTSESDRLPKESKDAKPGKEAKDKAAKDAKEVKPAKDALKKTPKVRNSPAFDKASYEADGGDAWIDGRREELFQNPVNKALWHEAEEATFKALGYGDWKFQVWYYEKQGGKW